MADLDKYHKIQTKDPFDNDDIHRKKTLKICEFCS